MPEPRKPRTADPRPNVIWVLADQLRAQALGHRGDPNVCTPNLDNLARDGTRFDNAVSGAPWCTPFRGALLTSMYPHQNGVTRTPSALDPSQPTIAQPFRNAGYHTAYFGKWHLHGSNSDVYIPPTARGGFDHWVGYENRNAQYDTAVFGTGRETPTRLDGYETDALTDLLLDHLRGHVRGPATAGDGTCKGESSGGPFFAVLSVQPPHDPYIAPPQFHRGRNPASIQFRPNVPDVPWVRDRFSVDLAGYYAMIENLDHNVGRLRAALRELDVDRETYIVFFADHGDCLGSHAQQQKSSPWEESIRIPFIVSRTGGHHRIRTGTTDAPLNHVDIAPTTLGLCGIDAPDWMVGHDYSNHCHKDTPSPTSGGGGEPDSAFLQQIPAKQMHHSVNRPWRAIVTRDRWKYAVTPGHDWLLFNLADDPYEQANYIYDNAFADQRQRLHHRLTQWIEDTDDTFDMPPL
jgi:arylsulfatase A-like enzyme